MALPAVCHYIKQEDPENVSSVLPFEGPMKTWL
jgi:hypothetical protein